MINIEELSNITGLQVKFIRRCMADLPDLLEAHITRGDKNSILYSNNAVVIFNQIKTYKDKGYSLPSIKDELAKTLTSQGDDLANESKQEETPTEQKNTSHDNDSKKTVSQLIEILKEKDNQLSKQQSDTETLRKEKETLQTNLQELEKQKLAIENSILLLTDGKSQEEILKEKHKKQEDRVRIAEIMKELEYLDGKLFKGKLRKQLIQELRDLQLQPA